MVSAQKKPLTKEELLPIALKNNAGLKASDLKVQEAEALIASAFNFNKTQIYYNYDENNLTLTDEPLRIFGIQQDFLFPTVYFSEKKLKKANYDIEASTYGIQKKELTRKITSSYYQYLYTKKKEDLLRHLDSLYQNFARIAQRRFELGETNYLEKITATSKQKQIGIQLEKAIRETTVAYGDLTKRVQADSAIAVTIIPINKIPLNEPNLENSIESQYYQNRIAFSQAERKYENQRLLPDITLEYFQGSTPNLDGSLNGYQLGLKIPLFFSGQSSKIKASKIAAEIAEQQSKEYNILLKARYQELMAQYDAHKKALEYYEQEGTLLSDEILKTANLSFKSGEIDFFQYIQSIENAYELKLDYLNSLNQYNQTVTQINYLTL